MKDATAYEIYETMRGDLVEDYRVPGVKDEFEEGSFCDQCYGRMMEACRSLYERLGIDSDENVERILVESAQITEYLCLKMFEYGKQSK